MADIGGVKPGYHNGEFTRIWTCPIEVFMESGHQLEVVNIYTDEGVLVLDVREKREEQ